MRFLFFLVFLSLASPALAQEKMRVVALGDSLTAGYGLPKGEDFATKLEAALAAEGFNVRVENAGVSGDTTAQGKARVEDAIKGEPKPRLVIVALGANDLLMQLPVAGPKENLRAILATLKDRDIPAFLIGMQNPIGGPFLRGVYPTMYEELADEFDVPLYPYFLKGVAMDKTLNLADGLHPNEKGIAVMVKNIAPEVAAALKE